MPAQSETESTGTMRSEELPEDLATEMLTCSSEELRKYARQLRRAGNKLGWRRRMQARTTATSAALRAGEKSLGNRYAGRERRGSTWVLLADCDEERVEAIHVELSPVRRSEDFFQHPVRIAIRRPDLVRVGGLKASAQKYLVEEEEDV